MIQSNKFDVTSSDGLKLFAHRWIPDEAPRAAMVIIHGLGDHGGRYSHYVEALVPTGIAVYAVDWRGHGRTPGKRGYAASWALILQDIDAIVEKVVSDYLQLPVFLFGQSLGGLIALDIGLRSPQKLKGVIASGPALMNSAIPEYLMVLARVLSLVWPSLSLETKLDPHGISRDPDIVQAYIDDPLVHGLGTPRLGAESQAAMKRVNASAVDFSIPLLILHGENDPMVPEVSSARFYNKVGISDKKRIIYTGGFHEPHNDIQYSQVCQDVLEWIIAHI